jgi:hypothetical protein
LQDAHIVRGPASSRHIGEVPAAPWKGEARVSSELEAAAADALVKLPSATHHPASGALCANCDAILQGPYCHACGQTSDNHKRSVFHLAWEVIADMFHLDGRLSRTLPDLFLRPGRLAKDYMEGRIARHVPPFRTFLVALLLYIFAAEHAVHEELAREAVRDAAAAAALATPQGRAREAAHERAEAAKDHAGDLADAAKDRTDDLRDPDERRDKVAARFAKATAKADARFAIAMDKAARVEQGLPPETSADAATHAGVQLPTKRRQWFADGLKKAIANKEYYLTVLFTWAHRMAALLLPIVALTLALAYRNRPGFFIHDHALVAMDLLSFTFLTNAVGFILPLPLMGPWFVVITLWTPVNLFQTLRGAYGSSMLGAVIKTVFVWGTTVTAFSVLLTALMLFTLEQL